MRTLEKVKSEIENFEGDKRSRYYKDLKAELISLSSSTSPTLGLGDIVAKVTEVTGIKKVVDVLTDGDCNCDKRQVKFNEFGAKVAQKLSFIFKGRLSDLNEEDYSYLCDFFKDGIPSQVSAKQQNDLNKIYYNVSKIIKSKTSCSSCVVQTVKSLYQLYSAYNTNNTNTNKDE